MSTHTMDVITTSLLCTLVVTVSGKVATRIVGGSDCAVAEFPYQGSLQIQSGSDWYHLCGCALYTTNKALTAAHCLTNNVDAYRLVFGMRSLSNEDGNEQYASVSTYTTHPNYTGHDDGYPNDIAVIHLTTNMDTTVSAVDVIALASGSDDFAGDNCVISGWGRLTGGGNTPDICHRANVTVITNAECASRWDGITGAAVNDSHICSYQSGISTCSGDFGGPLVCGNFLAGVASWGSSSCSSSYPSTYSRVSYFHSWIQGA